MKYQLKSNESFKFVGDNVDVSMGVRDMRSELCHMLSILAVKSRIQPPHHIDSTFSHSLSTANHDCFLPKESDVSSIRLNLAILVSRILCTYIKGFKKLRNLVPQHIVHRYSKHISEIS